MQQALQVRRQHLKLALYYLVTRVAIIIWYIAKQWYFCWGVRVHLLYWLVLLTFSLPEHSNKYKIF